MRKRDELTNPQSCMSRAADDEMTFVLLGRDKAAPDAIRFWCGVRVGMGKNKWGDPQILEALKCAGQMEAALNPTEQKGAGVAPRRSRA